MYIPAHFAAADATVRAGVVAGLSARGDDRAAAVEHANEQRARA